jgi:exodeoxyribonuclease III
VFRRLDSNPDRFTWWNQFGNARARNVGWRIDYQIATPGIAKKAKKASIYMDEVFSDHAPVVIDYDFKL